MTMLNNLLLFHSLTSKAVDDNTKKQYTIRAYNNNGNV